MSTYPVRYKTEHPTNSSENISFISSGLLAVNYFEYRFLFWFLFFHFFVFVCFICLFVFYHNLKSKKLWKQGVKKVVCGKATKQTLIHMRLFSLLCVNIPFFFFFCCRYMTCVITVCYPRPCYSCYMCTISYLQNLKSPEF